MWGKFINAGQTCIAPDYILIHKQRRDEFIKRAKDSIQEHYGSLEKIEENPDYCRIINPRHFKRVQTIMDEALDQGGELLYGGIVGEEDRYFSPTIIQPPPPDSAIMQEEIFGPLLPVIPYENLPEVLDMIQAKPRPLVLYIFSPREEFVNEIVSHTHSGDVVINDVMVHFANVKLPFGGVNNSGIGKSHGIYGFREFSHLRSVMQQGKITPAALFYPPYNRRVRKWIDILLKYF
jgi:aldehyde dehydrogenase (NAD+)